MGRLFWLQAYGERGPFVKSLPDNHTRRFAKLNYGPWDRLDGNKSFVDGIGPKPAGANFSPADMTKEEFAAWEQPGKYRVNVENFEKAIKTLSNTLLTPARQWRLRGWLVN
ncbi:MAG: hypothetical protein L3J24_07280 [Xanthomonadales bacterium]|nr:hypothetical protein [Xanthomonadales bacterium]